MWNKPWTMKEDFLIGGCLMITGLALELAIGPVAFSLFHYICTQITKHSFQFYGKKS